MAKRKIAGTFVTIVLLGATAGPLAGWTAYSVKSPQLVEPAQAAPAEQAKPQISNRSAKGDKLASAAGAPISSDVIDKTYSLAAIDPTPERPAMTPAPLPPQRPKRPPVLSNGMLDDAQIAGIKGRLRLTSVQAEHWPAVEAALREFGKYHQRESRKRHSLGSASQIDVNSPEVQRLIWAAMPLLAQLREDQKREVRTLVRMMGLETVAAQI